MVLSPENCNALLQHIVAATMAADRKSSQMDLVEDLRASEDLKQGPVALDSLDQLAVARSVTEFFEMDKTGAEELLLRRHKLSQWAELVVEGIASGVISHLWFRTGGSTGEPKLVSHPIDRLLNETREIAKLVGKIHRIVSLVPLHHIYGCLWGPLLSEALKVPLVHGNQARQVVHQSLEPGDLVIAVPEWWRYLAGLRTAIPAGVQGITSTAPCPPDILDQALKRGFDCITEVYGSSETGGIGWRKNRHHSFQLFPHWQKLDDDHLLAANGVQFQLPDLVTWQSAELLVPGNRRDGAIQVGGINVWPNRIRAFIESHSQVSVCAVRPTVTELGTRLKAFVVPGNTDTDSETLREELNTWLRRNLSAAERPVSLTLGDKLPRNPMGKLCDW